MTPMTATLTAELLKMLRLEEGLRLKPYTDSVGRLTIGLGRCLDTTGISEPEALLLANNDLHWHCDYLTKNYEWFTSLEEARKAALIDMQYNLGAAGFAGFKLMINALANKDYAASAHYALESRWADQVGQRAKRIAEIVRTGEYPAETKLESL